MKNSGNQADKYVGKNIGHFRIIRRCSTKSADGHGLYDIVCTKCGHELKNQRIADVKRKSRNDKCRHNNIQTNWYSRRLSRTYRDMLYRCYDSSNKSYKYYGGKGISVCDEWRNNPQSFNDWAIEFGYREDLTIDRIDERKNYCPQNCEWLPMNENAKWKGNTNKIFVLGVLDSGKGWARRLGVGVNYINRYKRRYGTAATEEMIKMIILETPELRREYLY